MRCQDTRAVSWLARFGRLHAPVSRYRCPPCRYECRPLLDLLVVEPGRISGALARLLAVLAVVAPYPLAARLAALLWGVTIRALRLLLLNDNWRCWTGCACFRWRKPGQRGCRFGLTSPGRCVMLRP